MSRRRAYLDVGVGETRGVVTLDDRPERLFLSRPDDIPALAAGARSIARVVKLDNAFDAGFLELPGGAEALLPLRKDQPRPVRGGVVEVEIRSEPRPGKLATAWQVGEGQGGPRLIQPAPTLEEELTRLTGEAPTVGTEARQAADEAESLVLAIEHALPGGGTLAIEPTRALTAVDIDTGARAGDSKRVARAANQAALTEGARLLRLKGIGGLVVFDLAGRGHDGTALLAAARAAFGPDNPGVAFGPISRFGTLELTIPRRDAPVLDRLAGAHAAALRLARRLEGEGRANPGARLVGRCNPAVAQAFAGLAAGLTNCLGARFRLEPRPDWPEDRLEAVAE